MKRMKDDEKALSDSTIVRLGIILGMVLLPTVLYLTFISNLLESELFLFVMWPPVLLGLGLLYYTIIQNLEVGRPSTAYGRSSRPVQVPVFSYKGRCPLCNGKVFHEESRCRWCDWEVVEDRLRPPV